MIAKTTDVQMAMKTIIARGWHWVGQPPSALDGKYAETFEKAHEQLIAFSDRPDEILALPKTREWSSRLGIVVAKAFVGLSFVGSIAMLLAGVRLALDLVRWALR